MDTLNYYPAQSTPLLMVYDGEYFGPADVLKFGSAMTVILVAGLFAAVIPYWGLLGLTLHK
ncbi:MAG: hypothetical protein ACYC4H_03660 [Desulfocucumaceae bacterium]